MNCLVCTQGTRPGLLSWHRVCPGCRYESASLESTINEGHAHAQLNEADREAGLKALRLENFKVIVEHARRYAPAQGKLLDVGSAHGWFLEAAMPHFQVLGLEPDEGIASASGARGLPVRQGYFPDVLQAEEKFDVIVFNDVIEHIPDIESALAACHEHLNPQGILIINLPCSRGFFYRLSKLFARFGWRAPFARMWQEGLPSPHVHYFDDRNLAMLASRQGFTLQLREELPSVRAQGLLARLRCAGDISPLALYTQYAGIMLLLPVLRAFPSDILLGVFRKP